MSIKNMLKHALVTAFAITAAIGMSITVNAEPAAEVSQIDYKGTTIQLSEHALYVDAALEADGTYTFTTLQAAVAAAAEGTKENPTVIYLAPDVYWTDDYTVEADRADNDLIGLIIPQPYITLAGMTGNPDDVVIASDRGQNAGADGNFNTIGVGDGFHAIDITIGNYCNVDLVYERDPSKSHTKRQEAITQAQAVTKVPGLTGLDEWYFENCNIVSRLNLFSRDDRPYRSYLKDCHLECTDDSLGTGYITIFDNCDFELYSNTPSGSASYYMQAYLGCTFTTQLSDNKVITLCKHTKPFAFIDCSFNGDMTGIEWKQGSLYDDTRQIVYNNTLNGEPLVFSPSRPEMSVTPDATQLEAFKYNGEYNIYNLLNGAGYEEWDPLGQKGTVPVGTWNIQFDYTGITENVAPVLEGDGSDSLEVTPIVLGGTDKAVTWSVTDDSLVIETLANGNVVVKGNNQTTENKKGCLVATAANGMEKVLHFSIIPGIQEAPTLVSGPTLSAPVDGKVTVSYELSSGTAVADKSLVTWYRAADEAGTNKVIIAQTTYVTESAVPYTSYVLKPDDADSYIFCEVTPKNQLSEAGQTVACTAPVKVAASDIPASMNDGYEIDLEHLAFVTVSNDTIENNYEWISTYESGNWYGGFYLPVEYRAGGIWSDKAYKPANEVPYTFAAGASGAAGTVGLQTTTQGARLVFVNDKSVNDMALTLTMSPHKTGAQGFGSAKQFLDIYFKYDAATMTGYGLRISREASIDDPALADYAAKSCTFTLMEYKNGVATPLETPVVSSTFLPGCTVVLEMKGNTLSADVTTTTAQDSGYPAEMPHEVHITHVFEEVNTYSGFGLQHTGTAGEGKSGNRTTIHTMEVAYGAQAEEGDKVTGLVQQPDGSFQLYIDGVANTTANTLYAYDGAWFVLKDGKVDTELAGIYEYDGAKFYVANGQVVSSANGLVSDGTDWYFVAYGMVQEVSTLAYYDGEWFIVKDGKLDSAYNGLYDYDGAQFLAVEGRLATDVTGLTQVGSEWYYLVSGQVVDYTGLVLYDGAWFYVVDGKLASAYVGNVEYDGAKFYVENGQVVNQVVE